MVASMALVASTASMRVDLTVQMASIELPEYARMGGNDR